MEMHVYTRRKRRQVAEINVVPYIDVMLVLLVIFMITAPLLQSGVEINLPDSQTKPLEESAEPQEPLIVSVDASGALYLSVSDTPSEPIEPEEALTLVSKLLRQVPNKPTLVEGDEAANYGDIMRAMSVLQAAGAKQIQLLTEASE